MHNYPQLPMITHDYPSHGIFGFTPIYLSDENIADLKLWHF